MFEQVDSIVERVGPLVPEVNKADFAPEVGLTREALVDSVRFRDRGFASAAWSAAHRAQAMLALATDPALQPPDRKDAPVEDRQAYLVRMLGQMQRIAAVRGEAMALLQSVSNRRTRLHNRGIRIDRLWSSEQEARSLAALDAAIVNSAGAGEESLIRAAGGFRSYAYAKAQLQMIDELLRFLEESTEVP